MNIFIFMEISVYRSDGWCCVADGGVRAGPRSGGRKKTDERRGAQSSGLLI